MLKSIVFDLDDTLYSEKTYVFSGFRAVAQWADAHLGIPFEPGYLQLRKLFEQGVRGNTFNVWLTTHKLHPQKIIPELIAVYRQHEPELSPYPEVLDVLIRLAENYSLGLVSDGYLDVQQKKWKALQLPVQFSGVVFSDRWGQEYWKPHTRPFEEVLRLCRSEGSQAVYIGDNPKKDFFGAKQLGMHTIRIRRFEGVYSDYEPPSKAYAPHTEITNFHHLIHVVDIIESGTI